MGIKTVHRVGSQRRTLLSWTRHHYRCHYRWTRATPLSAGVVVSQVGWWEGVTCNSCSTIDRHDVDEANRCRFWVCCDLHTNFHRSARLSGLVDHFKGTR